MPLNIFCLITCSLLCRATKVPSSVMEDIFLKKKPVKVSSWWSLHEKQGGLLESTSQSQAKVEVKCKKQKDSSAPPPPPTLSIRLFVAFIKDLQCINEQLHNHAELKRKFPSVCFCEKFWQAFCNFTIRLHWVLWKEKISRDSFLAWLTNCNDSKRLTGKTKGQCIHYWSSMSLDTQKTKKKPLKSKSKPFFHCQAVLSDRWKFRCVDHRIPHLFLI